VAPGNSRAYLWKGPPNWREIKGCHLFFPFGFETPLWGGKFFQGPRYSRGLRQFFPRGKGGFPGSWGEYSLGYILSRGHYLVPKRRGPLFVGTQFGIKKGAAKKSSGVLGDCASQPQKWRGLKKVRAAILGALLARRLDRGN